MKLEELYLGHENESVRLVREMRLTLWKNQWKMMWRDRDSLDLVLYGFMGFTILFVIAVIIISPSKSEDGGVLLLSVLPIYLSIPISFHALASSPYELAESYGRPLDLPAAPPSEDLNILYPAPLDLEAVAKANIEFSLRLLVLGTLAYLSIYIPTSFFLPEPYSPFGVLAAGLSFFTLGTLLLILVCYHRMRYRVPVKRNWFWRGLASFGIHVLFLLTVLPLAPVAVFLFPPLLLFILPLNLLSYRIWKKKILPNLSEGWYESDAAGERVSPPEPMEEQGLEETSLEVGYSRIEPTDWFFSPTRSPMKEDVSGWDAFLQANRLSSRRLMLPLHWIMVLLPLIFLVSPTLLDNGVALMLYGCFGGTFMLVYHALQGTKYPLGRQWKDCDMILMLPFPGKKLVNMGACQVLFQGLLFCYLLTPILLGFFPSDPELSLVLLVFSFLFIMAAGTFMLNTTILGNVDLCRSEPARSNVRQRDALQILILVIFLSLHYAGVGVFLTIWFRFGSSPELLGAALLDMSLLFALATWAFISAHRNFGRVSISP